MHADKFINETLVVWIDRYKEKESAYKRKYYAIIVIDILAALFFPLIHFAGFNLSKTRMIVILILLFMVFFVVTVKAWNNFKWCRGLIADLETERALFISSSETYDAENTRAYHLFVKRINQLISNSIPLLSDMPEGFSLSL